MDHQFRFKLKHEIANEQKRSLDLPKMNRNELIYEIQTIDFQIAFQFDLLHSFFSKKCYWELYKMQ